MKRKIFYLLSLVSVITLSSCSTFLVKEKPSYVKVKGTQFEIDGKPYYYAGTNLWYGCYLGSPGETGDRERLKRELDQLKSIGVTNLRVLAASEESNIQNSLKPAIQKSPGVYDEDLLEGLDFLLSEMKKRDMHAVIFLNNYWEWSGGMSQYNAWANQTKAADPSGPEGWGAFMKFSATFYTNQKANDFYRQHILNIVTRKNKFTDLYYYEDPTIMAWQLANEPRPGRLEDDPKNYEIFINWVSETAKYIHSIDPNHLVSTGSEGLIACNFNEELVANSHKTPYIDYLTCHLWPKNWGWFNEKRIDETFPTMLPKALNYIDSHIKIARNINKPLVMEEFGISRDSGFVWDNTPTTARDKYYKVIFGAIYDSASAGAPIVGYNFWTWGGEGRAKHPDGIWRKGDSFVGDPPQEPQGFNSIFNTDVSTLEIIKESATKLKSLSEKPAFTEAVKK